MSEGGGGGRHTGGVAKQGGVSHVGCVMSRVGSSRMRFASLCEAKGALW